jgi:DNA-binding SARP family transcriptional activator
MAKKPVRADQVRVRVLGKAEIHVGTRKIGMNTEAMFALALYLTTRAGERIPRDEVLDLFWPEGTDEARRHAKRQMLYRLRQKGFVFEEEGEFLRLDAARVDSDLRSCLAAEWPESAPAEVVEASLALGPTFSSRLPGPVLAWFDGVRTDVETQQRRAAQRQVVQARREGRWADLDRWARVILRSDPLNEEATLARAEAAAMEGSKVAALEIIDGYLQELGPISSDLGKPAQLLRRRIAERRADWSSRAPREAKLVGREPTMALLTACVDGAATGTSTHSHVVGGPGIGKSRLLVELRDIATLRGFRILAVVAEPMMTAVPFGLAEELIRRLLDLPGAAAAPPSDITLLRRLVLQGTGSAPSAVTGPTPHSRDHIEAAACRLLRAVAYETRLLMTIDDVHWGDEASVSLIASLHLAAQNTRCAILCAYRPDALATHGVQLARAIASKVRLRSLTAQESQALAEDTLALHRRRLPSADLLRVAEASGGNPLFVRELSLSRLSKLATSDLPDTLSKVIGSRLSSLSPLHTRVLRTISLLGDAATPARILRLSGAGYDTLQAAVEQLELDGMITERDAGLLHLHDCWREAVIANTPATLRMTMALECAEDLVATGSPTDPLITRRAAHLLHLAGERDRALDHLLQSCDALYALGLVDETLDNLDALSQLAKSPASHTLIAIRRARAELLKGDPSIALATATQCLSSTVLRGSKHANERLIAAMTAGEAALKLDVLDDGSVTEIERLAKSPEVAPEARLRACLLGMRLASNRINRVQFRRHLSESNTLHEQLQRTSLAGWVARVIGACEEGVAADIESAVENLPERLLADADIADRCLVERVACQALRYAGDKAGATHRGEAAFQIAIQHNLPHQARVAVDTLVFTLLDYCDTDSASHWITRGMELDSVTPFGTTRTSAIHGQDRLWMQLGDFGAVAARIADRLTAARGHGNLPSRFGELSLACYCYAMSGRERESASLANEIRDSLRTFYGTRSVSFCVELTARAYRSLGQAEVAREMVATHMRDGLPASRQWLAPFFTELTRQA